VYAFRLSCVVTAVAWTFAIEAPINLTELDLALDQRISYWIH
jgi:hypothetical protein